MIAQSAKARAIAAPYEAEFSSNFEAGMAKLMEHRPLMQVSDLYSEIALYLLKFRGTAQNSYFEILKAVGSKSCVFSTLNYDLLFEDAEHTYRHTFCLPGLPSRAIRFLKLHGSVNWIPDMGPFKITNLTMRDVGKFGNFRFHNADRSYAMELLPENEYTQLMPDMCLYMFGKESLYSNSVTAELYREWLDSVSGSQKIIVCGVNINLLDEHIWGPLSEYRKKVTYYGIEADRPSWDSFSKSGCGGDNFSDRGIEGLAADLTSGALEV